MTATEPTLESMLQEFRNIEVGDLEKMADDSASNGASIDPSDAQEVIRVLGGIRPAAAKLGASCNDGPRLEESREYSRKSA